ncbi:cation diffusion facilitator family transporter [Vibrio fluvialis]|uniref:cation diffusion facilitator family transporter n=1 Tax=Vibrio fluvialis TaxID=676 RepID=UPI001C9CDEC6|nr:cation diffusion facilitator family transporter [Vibrio fluvialis]EKO3946553.1 cation diffusion facilitator family transporter [Vibrio fluvialis]MBY7874716.1 cation diffusion facilitator family transporter [Vibrio fluvialis]MBY7878302.1 cation diffusion facilitator family transporter [Vibrio fluvialis]MBY8286388.1 cation diffusion facilitator family transporter [Vibrio fluvialis]MCE7647138.1 cation diffusion facilitator family transporter [Vibrio fluvialis]
MCARTSFNENRVLTLSALFASMFAGGGLIVGLLVGSLVIMFDGVYSLVSLLLTLLSLVAARYIRKPSDDQFPFGRAVFEPAVIAVKGAVILLIVSYSLYSAIGSMFTGGRPVDASVATAFGAINVVGCGLAWWYMKSLGKRHASGLIDAEVKQWQMDTMLSVAVTAGFVIAWLMTLTPMAKYAVYADPMMMLAMSFYFIKVPFEMLRSAMREIFLMAPSKEICQTVDQSVVAAGKESEQDIELAGVTKVGHELWVDVDIYPDSSEVILVEDIEQTRNTIEKRLSKLPLKLQITVNIAS